MYQSLHTTIFGPYERLIQIKIRTNSMDKTASYGISALWDTSKGQARYVMQEQLREKFQFYKSLTEIDKMFQDNQDFVDQIKNELFIKNVYAYTPDGTIIELPSGSTIIDYAYKIDPINAPFMVDAMVNDEPVASNYTIKNMDIIKIITSKLSTGPKPEWEQSATTSYAKKRIKEDIKRQVN